ncbi:hypothetical protein HZS_4479 [Henneguya salminicola]|nr:hypothetical protein HZS_4479 [Henneguya salminicola]
MLRRLLSIAKLNFIPSIKFNSKLRKINLPEGVFFFISKENKSQQFLAKEGGLEKRVISVGFLDPSIPRRALISSEECEAINMGGI